MHTEETIIFVEYIQNLFLVFLCNILIIDTSEKRIALKPQIFLKGKI